MKFGKQIKVGDTVFTKKNFHDTTTCKTITPSMPGKVLSCCSPAGIDEGFTPSVLVDFGTGSNIAIGTGKIGRIEPVVTKKAEAKKAAIEKKLGKMTWTVETDNDGSIYLEGWCRIMQNTYQVFADGSATINGNNLNLRFFK